MGLPDLAHVAPDVHRTLVKLQTVVHRKQALLTDHSLTADQRNQQVSLKVLDVKGAFGK